MKILNKILKYLFFMGVFFIPFNSFEGLSFLGEFSKEASVFFFIPGMVILFITFILRKKIIFPYKSLLFQVLVLFIFWCFLATLLNSPSLIQNEFKGTTGIIRFIRQYLSILLSTILFFIFYYNVLKIMSFNEILVSIRNVFLASLIVVSSYSFFEALISLYGKTNLLPVLELFNYFPFVNAKIHLGGRLSSVCYEPPFLAEYLIMISGWMFSFLLTPKGIKKIIPTILVLTLAFLSGSRTAFIVIFIQFFVFLFIILRKPRYRNHLFIFTSTIVLSLSLLVFFNSKRIIRGFKDKIETIDFKSNLTKNVSNQSRLGIQYASLQVFKENPLFGVGFGQQTFHNRFHYPSWATLNNYEFRLFYKNEKISNFPPGYNIYVRILTETGLIGFLIFLSLIILIFFLCLNIIKNKSDEKNVLGTVLLVSFIGFFINWLQIDSFRIYGIWICFAILILFDNKLIKKHILEKDVKGIAN